MSERGSVAVIGCGIFGAEVAIAAAEAGFSVVVYEAAEQILTGASWNNQNRLHLGFHYPRDLETGRQSIRGFQRFVERYPACIRAGFPNAYFIADEGSFVTPAQFLSFCEELGAEYTPIKASEFPVEVRGAASGVLCKEVVYDCGRLRELVRQRLQRSGVAVRTGQAVQALAQDGDGYRLRLRDGSSTHVDRVVNCSYADINRLTDQLRHTTLEREFEYTVVPIFELDMPKVGITIMDGPFMTVLPYGQSDQFLLYAVRNTVVARQVQQQLDSEWLNPATSPFAAMDKRAFFEGMIEACARFVPALANARSVGFLQGPRMVLARNDATDARPSLINSYGGYHTVFAGKIDHCVWVAEEVRDRLLASRGVDLGATSNLDC